MPVKINPKTLRGPWLAGFALDFHTTGSTFLGHNEYGHPVFDTGRSPMGELVYRLKYRGDKNVLGEIVDTLAGFLSRTWKLDPDILVPVPPSNTSRRNQPLKVDPAMTAGKKILLLDDLYRSGATAGTIARLLRSQGGAKAVYLLTLTQTRKSV